MVIKHYNSTIEISLVEEEYKIIKDLESQIEAQIVSIKTYGLLVEFGLSGFGLIHENNFIKDKICIV